MTNAEVQTISPLEFPEVTAACRVSMRLAAKCLACGTSPKDGVHLCDVAREAFLCQDCCPICSGRLQLTPEELKAIEANAAQAGQGDDAGKPVDVAKPPLPVALPPVAVPVQLPAKQQRPRKVSPMKAKVKARRIERQKCLEARRAASIRPMQPGGNAPGANLKSLEKWQKAAKANGII